MGGGRRYNHKKNSRGNKRRNGWKEGGGGGKHVGPAEERGPSKNEGNGVEWRGLGKGQKGCKVVGGGGDKQG